MDYDDNFDRLQLQHLAGSKIVQHPPLYGPNGEFLFIINECIIQIYSTVTGEITQHLTGATSNIISMEFELNDKKVLVACTEVGDILRWNWEISSTVMSTVSMHFRDAQVVTFNLINFYGNSDTACAFVTARMPRVPMQWFVVDTSSGLRQYYQCKLRLLHKKPLVAVDTKNFKNIVITQGPYVFFINYESWYSTRLTNAHNVPITAVQVHPTEEVVATGDENGRIFLWRQFMDKITVCTSMYHWHHTAVTSIAFSPSGASFYSSGLEAVLVMWNVANPSMRDFLPRMSSIILHIATSDSGNSQLAVCLADNGVQIIDGNNSIKCTLQEFTYVIDDNTGKSKFPVGLRLDPRTNALVLNGRNGHLQFYSVFTKSLLYNLDVVNQNELSMESGKILYNIQVTKAAFNIDWMATGEAYNDEEHSPELRLKFWEFQKKIQSYALNTNIEMPHEGGIKAIQFSSDYQVDNLLCATAGHDNIIKIWSLDETDNIYRKGKVWYCIGRTTYKSLPIHAISFSNDGSLLAVGFGSTLCIFKADNLELKAVLSSSPGLDGCAPKAQIRVLKQTLQGPQKNGDLEYLKKKQQIMKSFSNLFNANDETIIKELQKSLEGPKKKKKKEKKMKEKHILKPIQELDNKLRQKIFHKIMATNELNLFQKVLIFQKLKISCEVHPQLKETVAKYLSASVDESNQRDRYMRLSAQLFRLNIRDRFEATYRWHRYATWKRMYDDKVSRHLVPILATMNLSEVSKESQSLTNGKESKAAKKARIEEYSISELLNSNKKLMLHEDYSAYISNVQFAAGEFSHLVIVCYEHRVLIWNLLTLRVQSTLNLTVEHLILDPLTNLIAAFTKYNELHIFQPNVPLPIYQRRNMPKIHAAVWLPRGNPKRRSINLDWQAQSTLYFVTETQQIMYLGSPDDSHCDAAPPPILKCDFVSENRYSIFGALAAKQTNETQIKTRHNDGPLVYSLSGKSAMKSLIEMSTHTMPPLSLICDELLKSVVKFSSDSTITQTNLSSNGQTNRNGDNDANVIMNGNTKHRNNDDDEEDDEDDDDDDDDDNERKVTSDDAAARHTHHAIELQKELLTKEQAIRKKEENQSEAQIMEVKLRRIAEQIFELEI